MSLGARGEHLAAAYLERHGYRVVQRNLRLPPWGEIDLVAERDGVTVLVEVRARRDGDARFGPALASLSTAKQSRMLRAAEAYLAQAGDDRAIRIDLVAVTLDRAGRVTAIDHIENALA